MSLLANSSPAQTTRPIQPATAAAKQALAKPDYQIPFVTKTLANGLQVVVLPDTSVPLATVELAVRNGSFTEPPEFHGLSHLYEHMFFKPNLAVQLYGCESGGSRITLSTDPKCSQAIAMKSKIGDTSYLKNADQVSYYNGTTREEIVEYYF